MTESRLTSIPTTLPIVTSYSSLANANYTPTRTNILTNASISSLSIHSTALFSFTGVSHSTAVSVQSTKGGQTITSIPINGSEKSESNTVINTKFSETAESSTYFHTKLSETSTAVEKVTLPSSVPIPSILPPVSTYTKEYQPTNTNTQELSTDSELNPGHLLWLLIPLGIAAFIGAGYFFYKRSKEQGAAKKLVYPDLTDINSQWNSAATIMNDGENYTSTSPNLIPRMKGSKYLKISKNLEEVILDSSSTEQIQQSNQKSQSFVIPKLKDGTYYKGSIIVPSSESRVHPTNSDDYFTNPTQRLTVQPLETIKDWMFKSAHRLRNLHLQRFQRKQVGDHNSEEPGLQPAENDNMQPVRPQSSRNSNMIHNLNFEFHQSQIIEKEVEQDNVVIENISDSQSDK
jgi:hypothetical protein